MIDPADLIRTAMAMRVCISAMYNKRVVKLAPHALVEKHDELYLEAITLEQDGVPPNSKRLGTFKLAGLSNLALTGTRYMPERNADLLRPGAKRPRIAAPFRR